MKLWGNKNSSTVAELRTSQDHPAPSASEIVNLCQDCVHGAPDIPAADRGLCHIPSPDHDAWRCPGQHPVHARGAAVAAAAAVLFIACDQHASLACTLELDASV